VVVSYHMCEWRTFLSELRSPKGDVAILLTTFFLTVLIDLTVAISVGMVLAAFLFMKRMAEVTNVRAVTREFEDDDADGSGSEENSGRSGNIPAGVEVYEINGAFFFGAAETFKDTLALIAGKPKVLIIRMRNVLLLDSTGMHALKDVVHRSRKDGTAVLLSDVHMQPLVALTGSTVLEEIGSENVFSNLDDALQRARELLSSPPTQRRIAALAS
jgi:SulP family sulfate permease